MLPCCAKSASICWPRGCPMMVRSARHAPMTATARSAKASAIVVGERMALREEEEEEEDGQPVCLVCVRVRVRSRAARGARSGVGRHSLRSLPEHPFQTNGKV